MNHDEMRIEIGNPTVRRSKETMMLESILVGLDEVLMMDGASVKAAKGVVEENLRTLFEKVETQRKRISALEERVKQQPQKPRGRPRKEA